MKELIENYKTKKTLEKVKQIITSDKYLDYDNAANIKEIVPLAEYIYDEEKEAYHIVNMQIYKNGMVRFNNFWVSFLSIDQPRQTYKRKALKK